MKKVKIQLLKTAVKDMDDIAVYYTAKSGIKTAERITDKILSSLERLENFPLSGSYPPDEDLKKAGFRMIISGEYISVYRVVKNSVFIYHIFNGARDYKGLFNNLL